MLPPGIEHLNLLIVEDIAHTRVLLRGVLRQLGFARVSEASSVPEALEAIKASPPDIVITDWEMPGQSGLDLIHWLRRHPQSPDPMLPVILLTGHGDLDTVTAGRDAGATDFLVKPVSPRRIAERLADLIARNRNFVVSPGYVGPDRRRSRRPVAVERRAAGGAREGTAVLPPDGLLVARISGEADKLEHAIIQREQARALVATLPDVGEPAAGTAEDAETVYELAAQALAGLGQAAEAMERMRTPLMSWRRAQPAELSPMADRVLASLYAMLWDTPNSDLVLMQIHLQALRAILRSGQDPQSAATAQTLAGQIERVSAERERRLRDGG